VAQQMLFIYAEALGPFYELIKLIFTGIEHLSTQMVCLWIEQCDMIRLNS
jgi:hypothetical protein